MIDPPPAGYRFGDIDGRVWIFDGEKWVIYSSLSHDNILAQHNGLQVNYDWQQGYAHLHPLPDSDTVEAYYNDDQFYTTHSPPDWLEKERQEYQAGLWNSYFRYLYNLIKGPTVKVAINREWREIGKYRALPKILDYGCGGGWFLNWLYNNTPRNHFGVEPSKMARDMADRHTPHIYASADELRGVFDVISLQLVLEHVVDPVKLLKSLSGLLAPDGRLLITVPNDFNPLQAKIGYWGFICPVHINYFTPDSLAYVLREAGYKPVYEGSTFPMELFVLAGLNYIGNDRLGRRCHRIRLRLEKLFGWRIFGLYKRLYDKWRIGRELVFVAERIDR